MHRHCRNIRNSFSVFFSGDGGGRTLAPVVPTCRFSRAISSPLEYISKSPCGHLCFLVSTAHYSITFFVRKGKFYASPTVLMVPPPTMTSPSYKTTDCPLVMALWGSSNSTRISSAPVWVTVAHCSGWR